MDETNNAIQHDYLVDHSHILSLYNQDPNLAAVVPADDEVSTNPGEDNANPQNVNTDEFDDTDPLGLNVPPSSERLEGKTEEEHFNRTF